MQDKSVDYPAFAAPLGFDDIALFVNLVRVLKSRIALDQVTEPTVPPLTISLSIRSFLGAALHADDEAVQHCWVSLRAIAWEIPKDIPPKPTAQLINVFLEHGLKYHLGFHDLYPPTKTCIQCQTEDGTALELTEPKSYPATLFTKDWGPVPVWTTSLYCRECKIRYYANYFLHANASTRTYYAMVPEVIQISQKYFMESLLVELFANLMTIAWASATNCARLYNMGFGNPEIAARLPRSWPVNLHMDCENVWDAFFLYGLLCDHREQGSVLELPHRGPNNANRLRAALEVRNERMAGPGQVQWNHACEKCTWVTEGEDGIHRAVRATVTDGVTLGHPCRAVHDCQLPLASQRDIYCPAHAAKNNECVVVECVRLRDGEWKTCNLPEHRQLEEYQKLQGKVMFQLKRRLQRVKAAAGHDSIGPMGLLVGTQIGQKGDSEGAGALEGAGVDGDEEIYVDRDGIILEDMEHYMNMKLPVQGNQHLGTRGSGPDLGGDVRTMKSCVSLPAA